MGTGAHGGSERLVGPLVVRVVERLEPWVVNAAARTIDVLRLAPGGYRLVTHLAAAACCAPVDLAFGVATAKLNLPALL